MSEVARDRPLVLRRRRYELTLAQGQVILRTRRSPGLLALAATCCWLALAVAPCGLPAALRSLGQLPLLDAELRWGLERLDELGAGGLIAAGLLLLAGLYALHSAFQAKELVLEGERPLRIRLSRFGDAPQEWEVPRARVATARVARGRLSCGDESWLLPGLLREDAGRLEAALRRSCGGRTRSDDEREGPGEVAPGCRLWLVAAGSVGLAAASLVEPACMLPLIPIFPLALLLAAHSAGEASASGRDAPHEGGDEVP